MFSVFAAYLESQSVGKFLRNVKNSMQLRELARVSLPSLLYFMQGLFVPFGICNLSPALFVTVSQLNILMSALFSLWILSTTLSCVQ